MNRLRIRRNERLIFLEALSFQEDQDVISPSITSRQHAKEKEMNRIRVFCILVASLAMLVMAGCISALPSDGAVDGGTSTGETVVIEADEQGFMVLDPNNFTHSTGIDNEWFSMEPGTKWVFEGSTEEDGERIPRRIEFVVTDLTKVIEDVPTVMAWITDYEDDELVESEIAFYAQDDDGNVWYLGEYPEEYEEGEFVDAPAWIAGQEDALAGIQMWADPQAGTPSYPQGWAPAVEWSDRGQVYAVGQETCVPVDCYKDVLVIDEFNQEEPNAFQQKYYARGVGNVRVGWRGEDAQQEELELVDRVQLDTDALAKVHAEALALEQRAYENSPDVYGHTEPAK